MSGAKPVLVDEELPWFTIDPKAAASAIGPRTCAILAVHLYGQPADLTGLQTLCGHHGLALIEDCAQSHGVLHGRDDRRDPSERHENPHSSMRSGANK